MTLGKSALPAHPDNIHIIPACTSHPSNIGSTAYTMRTMGLHRPTVIAPGLMTTPMTENPPILDPKYLQSFRLPEENSIPASDAVDALESATIAASLDEALADTIITCILTSRRREITASLQTPHELVPELL